MTNGDAGPPRRIAHVADAVSVGGPLNGPPHSTDARCAMTEGWIRVAFLKKTARPFAPVGNFVRQARNVRSSMC